MINKDKLRGAIRAKGYTLHDFCNIIGMGCTTFIRKETNDSFGLDEVQRIVHALHLTHEESVEIFFANCLT